MTFKFQNKNTTSIRVVSNSSTLRPIKFGSCANAMPEDTVVGHVHSCRNFFLKYPCISFYVCTVLGLIDKPAYAEGFYYMLRFSFLVTSTSKSMPRS